ncbi:MAG: nucleotide exchange factor GrpE, partial [Huintestinicola sp.]
MPENEKVTEGQDTEEIVSEDIAAGNTAAEESTDEPEVQEESEADKLRAQLAEEKEKYLRMDAEYYNYRTR